MDCYTAVFRLHVSGEGSPAEFEQHLDDVLDELDKLEAIDADVTASLAKGDVTINFALEAESPMDAGAKASALLRSAIHGCEGHTPAWPTIEEFRFETARFDEDPDDITDTEPLGA